MTPQLPNPSRAIDELRETIKEREQSGAWQWRSEIGQRRIKALRTALEICEITKRITYYEQSDPTQN